MRRLWAGYGDREEVLDQPLDVGLAPAVAALPARHDVLDLPVQKVEEVDVLGVQGGTFDDDIQTQLASTLGNITDDDLARPIVVYCIDANCWLSYNAALRFDALGYENLYWYRGGIAAWKAANLPTRMASR